MKHLDNIHPDRFYTDLVDNAFLIHEVVQGETESGEWITYYNFDDAEDEASYDGASLSEYGNAFYFKDDKIYDCVIYLENMECTGVNLLDDPNEIKSFVQELLSLTQDDEDELLDQNPWAKKYLVKENNNSMEQQNLKFEGNFGTINLTVESDGYAMGQYQDGGILEGDFIDGEFKGQWRNKGMEGLVQFTVVNGQLNGTWKKGLDNGPMKGKWKGALIDLPKDTADEVSSMDNQSEGKINKKELSVEQEIDMKKYPLFPVNWGVENVIVVPIRHCMVANGDVNEMKKNAMAHFFENFGKIGEDAELEWDITDDQIVEIHNDGNYGELLAQSAIYLKEKLDEDQLSQLIWYMALIVSEDKLIQYSEFITLKFYFDRWYPDALDTYLEKFRKAGMIIITKPNK